jgi:hypothetical protein
MLIAPEAPAPKAMQSTAIIWRMRLPSPGARYRPTKPVKTTRDITLGFNKDTKSRNGVQTETIGLDTVSVTKTVLNTIAASKVTITYLN